MSGEDRSKRKGRGRSDEVPSEELGWIEDLRQARAQGGDLGPGTGDEAPPPARGGRRGLLGGRRGEERRDDPRFEGLRGTDSRDSDLPSDPPRGSSSRGLGSRFASLRGMRGSDRGPSVPVPALSPLPPEVVKPRSVPPVPQRAAERPRPPRDFDEPGRHETVPPPVRGTRPTSGPPAPGRVRPTPPPPGRPGEPAWHDLATGEKPPVRHSTGEQPPVRRGTGEQPPIRRGTAEQPPVRRGTGEQPPTRRGTGEQPPIRRSAGEQPPVRRSTGEQPPIRRGTGEQPPIRRGTAEQPSVRRGTGEQPPIRRTTGEQPPAPPRRASGEHPVVERPLERPASRRAQLIEQSNQLRQQVREARKLRLVSIAAITVVLLAALPAVFLIRDASADPVFAGLDSLGLPGWAQQSHLDASSGNRWCIQTCPLRERTWRSGKPLTDTAPVYEQALTGAGWHRWRSAGCPTGPGAYSCWQRDEYVLDLWVRDAPCDLAPLAPAPGTSPSGLDPSAAPVPTPTSSGPPPTCGGSLITAKVATLGDPNWHQ